MQGTNVIYTSLYRSACGDLILGEYGGRLCLCDWVDSRKRRMTDAALLRLSGAEFRASPSDAARLVARQLDEYFAGSLTEFDIPLQFFGTEFRQRVWTALCDIPYGETLSYGSLAERLGDRGAVRAVAAAVGANPMSIVVPCHRVIGSDGRLVGYAGGVDAKRFLLGLERDVMTGGDVIG